jgi:hypothetical protein
LNQQLAISVLAIMPQALGRGKLQGFRLSRRGMMKARVTQCGGFEARINIPASFVMRTSKPKATPESWICWRGLFKVPAAKR